MYILITFYFSHLLLSFLLVCTFVLILASTAKAIDKNCPINIVSQPRIEPGTLWFQDYYEMHDAIMTSMERSKVGTKEKRSPNGLNYPYQNTIMINIIC